MSKPSLSEACNRESDMAVPTVQTKEMELSLLEISADKATQDGSAQIQRPRVDRARAETARFLGSPGISLC